MANNEPRIPTPTGFCIDASEETIRAALDLVWDQLTDDERDNVNTAMAWLKEAAENDSR